MLRSLPSLSRWLIVTGMFIGLGGAFAFVYLSGLQATPFHPDESSQLFMSRDFDMLFLRREPAALAWQPDEPLTPDVRLRLLDAPITRYLAGLGWWARGFTAADLNVDWVWGATWEENQAAIPPADVLWAARAPTALLGALTAVLALWWGIRLGGWPTGLTAALLVGLDPLMLLHTRRAMAESALTFFSALAAVGSLALVDVCDRLDGFRWRAPLGGALVGALVGLALCSKQTEIVMLPVALLASGGALRQRLWPLRQRLIVLVLLSLGIGVGSGLTFWLLNPVLSQHPVSALREMLTLRSELVESQIQVNGERDPEVVLGTAPARLRAMVQQLYWQPPAVWDAPVYLEHLQPEAEAYFAEPLHLWLRRPPWPWLLMGLTALGLGVCVYHAARDRLSSPPRAEQVLLLWFGMTLVFLALVIPLNWQRYFLPLLVPSRLLAALGAGVGLRWIVGMVVGTSRVQPAPTRGADGMIGGRGNRSPYAGGTLLDVASITRSYK